MNEWKKWFIIACPQWAHNYISQIRHKVSGGSANRRCSHTRFSIDPDFPLEAGGWQRLTLPTAIGVIGRDFIGYGANFLGQFLFCLRRFSFRVINTFGNARGVRIFENSSANSSWYSALNHRIAFVWYFAFFRQRGSGCIRSRYRAIFLYVAVSHFAHLIQPIQNRICKRTE
jgi:hypothetical protein